MKSARVGALEAAATVATVVLVMGVTGAAFGGPRTSAGPVAATPDGTPPGQQGTPGATSPPGSTTEPETENPTSPPAAQTTAGPTSTGTPAPTVTSTGPTSGSTTPAGGGGTQTGPPPPIPKQCEDGVDNDGDGKIDVTADPGCESSVDDDERDVVESFYASTITIRHDFSPHSFGGVVSSAHFGCVESRPIVLKKVRRGADARIARGRTTTSGRWRLPHSEGGRGRYYVIARKITFGSQAAPIVCLRDRSAVVRTSG